MQAWIIAIIVAVVLVLLPLTFRVVKQYERGIILRFGRLARERNSTIIPLTVDIVNSLSGAGFRGSDGVR